MTWIFLAIGAVALAYQAVALVASLVHWEKSRLRYAKGPGHYTPPVSILKPVHGLDAAFEAAIASHAAQDYPEFEILFGVPEENDPAIPAIRRLMEAHPDLPIRLIVVPNGAANGKVSTLIELAKQARHPVWLVNDADIHVPPDYLRRVVAPLEQSTTGIVTCLYRAAAWSPAGWWEALGIATDFIPSTLVAPFVGVNEFGLGSTLCFRAEDLRAAGGFEALAGYIADDYQLAKNITSLGKRATVSEVVVSTVMADPDWRAVWRHQLRWARTVRVSRTGGYRGLPVTHAGLWALANAVAGNWSMAITLWVARTIMGLTAGVGVLRFWPAVFAAPLIPLWDLWAFAVWAAGLRGAEVWWRGRKYTLHPDGRITPA